MHPAIPRSVVHHQIRPIILDGYQPTFATSELAAPEGIPQTPRRLRSHSMAVDFPVRTDVAEEAAPFGPGQSLPAPFGMWAKLIDNAAPIETDRLGLADLRPQPSKQSKQTFRRRFARHEVMIGTCLGVLLGEQTTARQSHDRSFVLLVEQTQNHVHGG